MNTYLIHKIKEFSIKDVGALLNLDECKNATRNTKEFYYNKSTTGFDSKVAQGILKVKLLHPEQYIQQAAFIQGRKVKDVIKERLEDVYKDIYTNQLTGENTISKLMDLMEKGTLIYTPYYTVNFDFQDGFHRSMAAYLLKIEYIPVIINIKQHFV